MNQKLKQKYAKNDEQEKSHGADVSSGVGHSFGGGGFVSNLFGSLFRLNGSDNKKKSARKKNAAISMRERESKHTIRAPNLFTSFKKDAGSFWDVRNHHHVLPVFTAGQAFVPSSFDTLLCQSFYCSLTPLLVESLSCGQKNQTMYQVKIPVTFAGRTFKDLFRACISRNVLLIGLYRAASEENRASLPFVCANPKHDTILYESDKMFVYSNPIVLRNLSLILEMPLTKRDLKGVAVDANDSESSVGVVFLATG